MERETPCPGKHAGPAACQAGADAPERERLEEMRKRHFEIAQALSSDYESIYYINTETGNYVEYISNGQYKGLSMQDGGSDFFADAQENLLRVVYGEDQDMVSRALDRDALLGELERSDVFVLTYRLVIDGVPTYYSYKAVRAVNDREHIVVGVSNVDKQKRRELEFEAQLRRAMDLANLDGLTGIRNRNAYMLLEERVNEELGTGHLKEFAVVICDVNDLKSANDNLGHAAGDQLIKNACRLVCTVFSHSPVFRIGGDEFLALLRDRDYENRRELLARLDSEVRMNARANQQMTTPADIDHVVLASGIGVFDARVDSSVSDVFVRADAAMYENKKSLKGEEGFYGTRQGSAG